MRDDTMQTATANYDSEKHLINQNAAEIYKLQLKGFGVADFDIAQAPLRYAVALDDMHTSFNLNRYSSKKVVYRTDNGDELGVHSDMYKPVAPKQMIEATRKILERSDLNLEGITENIQMSHGGARTYVQYNLPAHTYLTPDGDTAKLSLLAITSLDSTWPFQISAGAVQTACLNMQVFTSGNVAVYKSKHTEGLDIDHGSEVIVRCLDVFENQRDLWANWYRARIDIVDAFKTLAEASGWKAAIEYMNVNHGCTIYEVLGNVRSNKNFDYMWSRHLAHYTKKFGHTYWALYNSLTDWATHAPLSKRSSPYNASAVIAKRQEIVRLTTRNWL